MATSTYAMASEVEQVHLARQVQAEEAESGKGYCESAMGGGRIPRHAQEL